MTGPFTPEDFIVHGTNPSAERAAEIANAIFAEKRACPAGEGGHVALLYEDSNGIEDETFCVKCGAKLRVRWEAV